ncbi:hypothetical protein [Oryzobacter telluris]|uniref:hypothetical protein n=1 Tax=Oryzobacter telluris TaxID=3149179 RepID=UPI00370D164C
MADEDKVETAAVNELLDPVIGSWDEGIARIRNGARWILVVIGAGAAFIFGTGTLGKRPELSWSANTGQLVVALACALVAVLLLGLVVREVARVFTPEVVALEDLEATAEFAGRELDYFGPRALPGVPAATHLRFAERAVVDLEHALSRPPFLGTEDDPDPDGLRAGVEAALREARQRLVEYQAGAAALLGLARYRRIETKRSVRAITWWAAGGALALGIVYQLVLSTPAAEDTDAAAGGGAASPGSGLVALVLDDKAAGAPEVWKAVGLKDCAPTRPVEGVTGTVALVELVSGSGTAESPWTIRTLPETSGATCRRIEVVLPHGVATTVTPVPVEVTVTVPTPTVTWRIGGGGS